MRDRYYEAATLLTLMVNSGIQVVTIIHSYCVLVVAADFLDSTVKYDISALKIYHAAEEGTISHQYRLENPGIWLRTDSVLKLRSGSQSNSSSIGQLREHPCSLQHVIGHYTSL